jgi:beta-1,4-mannosyltransferase
VHSSDPGPGGQRDLAGPVPHVGRRRLRVASVPATHVYVRRLAHPLVERLTDPSGDDHRTPCFLDPAWWRDVAPRHHLDVLHVNFGFEYHDPDALAQVCEEAHRRGVAVVHTCHDLRNPNHATPELHDAGLAVWLRHADEVVTLTEHAAAAIRAGWGRTATVLPHPHVVPEDELRRRAAWPRRRHGDRVRVGLHLKSLRANLFGAEVLDAALGVLAAVDGLQLEVHVHHDVLDPTRRVHDPGLVDRLWTLAADAASRVDLQVHHHLSDDQLWDAIAGVDVFVLPYRFGTHSGLLEACRDLGTAVVAPSCGGYADQGAHHRFDVTGDGRLDAASFAAALRAAVTRPRPAPLRVAVRVRQREEVAAGYLAVYRRAVATVRARSVA